MSQFQADNWHREAANITVRNGVQPRRWGQRVTVYNDPTPANNGEYVLTYGLANTNRSNNNNWLKVADVGQTWGGGGGGSTAALNQSFNTTGVESSFTVSNGTLDQINFVEVNGAVQRPGTDYTVTGQVVDFGSALPAACTVVVYYYEGLSIGATPTLEEVLTAGSDAGGLSIQNLLAITSSATFDIDATGILTLISAANIRLLSPEIQLSITGGSNITQIAASDQNILIQAEGASGEIFSTYDGATGKLTIQANQAVGGFSTLTVDSQSQNIWIADDGFGNNTTIALGAPGIGVGFQVTFTENATPIVNIITLDGNGYIGQISGPTGELSSFTYSGTESSMVFQTIGSSAYVRLTDGLIRMEASTAIRLLNLPTSAAGLPADSLWNNAGVVNIT